MHGEDFGEGSFAFTDTSREVSNKNLNVLSQVEYFKPSEMNSILPMPTWELTWGYRTEQQRC